MNRIKTKNSFFSFVLVLGLILRNATTKTIIIYFYHHSAVNFLVYLRFCHNIFMYIEQYDYTCKYKYIGLFIVYGRLAQRFLTHITGPHAWFFKRHNRKEKFSRRRCTGVLKYKFIITISYWKRTHNNGLTMTFQLVENKNKK